MKKVVLNAEKELIIREKNDVFSSKYGRSQYRESCKEIIVKTDDQLLCIGICFTNTFNGKDEFIQYNSRCVLFFEGNSITKQYHLTRVFDIETMRSVVMTKEEVKEKYDIDLPEEIKNPTTRTHRRKNGNRRLAYLASC